MACLVLLIILAGFFFLPRHPQAFDSIAVLPVENVSGDPEQEAFCYGIHQDLIAQLSSIKAFKKVIDKNTMMTFKGTKKKSSEIAKELKVSAIVTANAVRSGSRVRIRFEVVDGLNNSQIGGDRFDGEYRDILSLEGQAAVAIAQKIQVALTPDEAKAVTQKKPVNPEAHNAYQKGMLMLGKEDISSAIPYFEQALDIDPDFAQAYAGLSLAYDFLTMSLPPQEMYPKARAAAEKALSLDDSLAEPHIVLGDAKYGFDWDWEGAEKEFQRALELNSNSGLAHALYGQLLAALGRCIEGAMHAEKALAVDPLTGMTWNFAIVTYIQCRQDDKACELAKECLNLFPNFKLMHVVLSQSYVRKKMLKEAAAEYQRAIELGCRPDVDVLVGLGEISRARDALNDLFSQAKEKNVDPLVIARAYVSLGEEEKALDWLEKGYEQKSFLMPWIRALPHWDPLRSDPRFIALLKKMRLEK
jgi:TolB-like protein